MLSKKLFLFVSLVFLVSCSKDDLQVNQNDSQMYHNKTMMARPGVAELEEFEMALKQVSKDVGAIVVNSDFESNPTKYESDLKLAMHPLLEPSKKLMIAADINENEVPELSNNLLADDQIITIGLLIYSQEAAASDPSVLDCVARAFVGFELHDKFWQSFTTRRALVTAVGKVASRYLGVVGAALIVYDFTDCMGWI